MFDFDLDKCKQAKETLKCNDVWRKKFAPSNKVGNCTRLYRFLKPTNEEDFYKKYLKFAETNKTLRISLRGLTYDELINLSERYRDEYNTLYNKDYCLETFFYDVLQHVIVETYQGQKIERDFIVYLNHLGYKCSSFTPEIDATYGLDIKVNRKDGKVFAVQIKPISFFIAESNNVQTDRINLCKKYVSALNNLRIKTYYSIYVKDKKTDEVVWVKNGDGFRFCIDDLFEFDENDIDNTFSRKNIPVIFEQLPVNL